MKYFDIIESSIFLGYSNKLGHKKSLNLAKIFKENMTFDCMRHNFFPFCFPRVWNFLFFSINKIFNILIGKQL